MVTYGLFQKQNYSILMGMKTKAQLEALMTKRNAPLIRQCILILETMPASYILKEKRQVQYDISLIKSRGKKFYKPIDSPYYFQLKDLNRKLKYLRLITARTRATNSRTKL
jgi:hypothetical protein